MDLTITLSRSKGFDENGKEKTEKKTYHAPSPKLEMVRKTLVLLNENDMKLNSVENMDKLVNYAVELFGNQFKSEDVYNQLDAENAYNQLIGYVDQILSTLGLKLQQIPPNQMAAK